MYANTVYQIYFSIAFLLIKLQTMHITVGKYRDITLSIIIVLSCRTVNNYTTQA